MEKRLVFVVIVDMPEEQEQHIQSSVNDWKQRMEGAYGAKVRIEGVKTS